MTESQIETDVLVSLDAFPAKVLMPSGTSIEPVRAVIADGKLQVYQAAPSGGAELVFERESLSTEGTPLTALAVMVWDGLAIVSSAGGCGCGSALRSVDLFPGRRRINVPL